MLNPEEKRSWLHRPLSPTLPWLTSEVIIFLIIVALTVFSRLYKLGERPMSHDESVHVYLSWVFEQGDGYRHSPSTHGPLQFHLIALTYLLLGDNDFTARLPHAIASILTVIMLWKGRRYLGSAGTLIAAGLVLISPYMLYYGRYARNEAFVAMFGVMTLYAVLRYLETGKNRYLLLLTLATVLHFITKETAFIYTAQALLFLAIFLINRITRAPWKIPGLSKVFIIILGIGILLTGAALGMAMYGRTQNTPDASQISAPSVSVEPATGSANTLVIILQKVIAWMVVSCAAFFLAAAVLLIIGYGWQNLRRERSFDMLILLGTFVLPQLTPFPVKALGWDPLAYTFTWPGWDLAAIFAQAPAKTAVVLVAMFALSIGIGLAWDRKRWLVNAALFWGIYTVFYTSLFTNWAGMATGIVGSLGYWLEQQGVQRGHQPWYYYLLLQVPFYEFLPALGVGLAAYFGFRRKKPALASDSSISTADSLTAADPALEPVAEKSPAFTLLLWWSLTSLAAFTVAGEKMPWLTVHITLPMILLTGWGLGQVVERLDWQAFHQKRGWLAATLMAAFFLGLASALANMLGLQPPFQGKTLEQLSATGTFLFSIIATLASAGGLYFLLNRWRVHDTQRLAALVFFTLLAVLTGRTAVRAAYIHPGEASEYLVYAHGADGIKDAMEQVDLISSRIAGEHDLVVAYDNGGETQGVAWPLKWYLRMYPNAKSFTEPGQEIMDSPVIIVDPQNYDKIETVAGNAYYRLEFNRVVWPDQDYFDLTWKRIDNAISNPALRSAIFQIWLNRDYTEYAALTSKTTLTASTWSPADRMALYILKSDATKMWEYPIVKQATLQPDPYEAGQISLAANVIVGATGSSNGQFSAPHGIAIAPDGTIYVADTNNNRIQHFSADGQFINSFGFFIDPAISGAPLGSLNQPWDVAVSPDGEWVYVADTWNHRVVKFTADGTPVKMWGQGLYDPQTTDPFGIWGPRGIAVDERGRIFLTDTGNKRIMVYDGDGNFVMQIGSGGMTTGQLEEPVGLAFDRQGNLYVVDTWNQRIQVFVPNSNASNYSPTYQWSVSAWDSETLDNKPYIAVDRFGNFFITDPEGSRVLEFTIGGEFVHTWGDYGANTGSFGLASGIAVDGQGRVWVSDAINNRLVRFVLP